MGRGNVISKETIESNPGCYPVFSSSATGDGIIGHYAEYMFDDERISWSIDGGGKFFYHPISRYSVTNVSGWIKVHKQDEISTRFLYLALDAEWQTKHFDYQTKAHPSVIKNEYTVIYPAIDKQHEITTTIASCENHIAALQALITKYEAIKKATVNLLLKPKDNWHSIKLKEFESHKNNTCSRSLTTANSGRIHNIHYGDILVKFNEIVSLKDCRIDCLTNEGELRSPADYIQDGDIIIADTAEDETAGKIVEMRDLEDNKAVAGLHTVFLRPPKTLFARGWLGYWMNSRYYHDQLLPYMTGIKVLSLSRSSLSRTEVFYPSRLEQERIVSVFESINSHISALQCQAEKMQKLKDGMMTYFFG